jgi:Flp pilus assembly protein TadD
MRPLFGILLVVSLLCAEDAYKLALAAFQTGRFSDCLSLLDRLPPGESSRPAAYNLRSLALAELRRYEEALAANRQARALDPENPNYVYNGGLISMNRSDYAGAEQIFEAAIAKFPDSARLHTGLGETLIRLSRFKDAERELQRGIELDPGSSAAYAALAELCYSIGDGEKLAGAAGKAIELDPENYLANYYWGKWLLEYRGDTAQGAAAIRKSVVLQPRFVEGLKTWGHLLERQGRWSEAAGAYEAALSVESADGQLWYLLSVAARKGGDSQRAEQAMVNYRKLTGRK